MMKETAGEGKSPSGGFSLLKGRRCLVIGDSDVMAAIIGARFGQEGATLHSHELKTPLSSDPGSEIEASFEAAQSSLGGVDVVVHASSVWTAIPVSGWSAEGFLELSKFNAATAVSVGRSALAAFTKNPRAGAICFVSSVWSLAASPEMGLAGASKASLGPITKALALQGAGQGHRANLIIHGLVDTPAFRKLALERAKAASVKEDVFERTVSRIPLQRAGKPEEIASAAAFICSDRLRHVNGVSLLVDGGLLYA